MGVVKFAAADAVASVTSSGEFSDARPGFPSSVFGKCARVRLAPASPAT